MAQNNQLQELINRIAVLEANAIPLPGPNYKDPPLYFTNRDGTRVNIDCIEKIPDLVKDLPIFAGEPSELNSWIDDVESIIKLYETDERCAIDAQNKFHMVCKTIRRKIRGEANDALVASNVGINWNLIKKTQP